MRRISAALSAILATIVNVITLPFRVIGRLLGSPRRGATRRGSARTRRRPAA